MLDVKTEKPVRVIYFTDPICSACWGIEPQLRRLKREYGRYFNIEYHMGGLLPDWSYNSGGISKPSDVAHHWDEVSRYYDMPIDGDVWLEDPLDSSYPPSIAFKAAQMQDEGKAVVFMRYLREKLFLEKKNITKWKYVAEAATFASLDVEKLKTDYEGAAKKAFEKDLELGRSIGVRGFPTLIFVDSDQNRSSINGVRPYKVFVNALKTMVPDAISMEYDQTFEGLFDYYTSLTAREYSELAQIDRKAAEELLEQKCKENILTKVKCKNGSLYKR